ncbi:SDR family oxidoreductase [Falsibacillus albus]|uniref:SDR family oxidoreductase n=1 Tax=Falsibacillus albus TaxID=2478915 RepID=A0A3L7JTG0_9BACI|nr:SDR family oxidoreductase [Falsibacillus albus]RLQ93349.1 SDR family oxidoreductase [Falsibacillus albus]
MKRKTAVITGASSGFGLLTAIELAKNGFYVLAAIRNLEKKQIILDFAKENHVEQYIEIIELDVASHPSIEQFRKNVNRFERIEVLVNNAGYAQGGFAEEVTIEEYKLQFETNFFGLIAVTQAVLPIMRKNTSGLIINMGSVSGQIGFPGLSPYVSSKFALEGWSESLRLEVKPFGIDVVIIEPGSYSTNIWSAGKKVAPKSLQKDSPYFPYMLQLENELEKGGQKRGNPIGIAQQITYLVNHRGFRKLRYPMGKGIKSFIWLKKVLPWRLMEHLIMKRLDK